MTERRLDIRRLKELATRLPRDYALRELLLAEDDELEMRDFLSKMSVWLRLADFRSPLDVNSGSV
ncbi:hypothetical protein MUP00_09250 [Candidatus Bathyarchaeota archaeon]|nr:hypothetical protein [Candidatus Bathyarchaeota archaeon]